MLSYLNQLNKELGGSKIDQEQFNDRTVHKDAMALSWECLKEQFKPSVIDRDNALAALAVTRGDKAEAHLRYLEDRLSLVQTIGASKAQIRFSLDPLAEYLAALHLITLYDSQEEKWLEFFAVADVKPGSPASINGFLSAVRVCLAIHESSIHITPRLWARMNSMQDLSNSETFSTPQLGRV
jgi:hypothetical protein